MEEIVRKIIKEIPSKCIFDSHYVIKTIISENSDDYLKFVASYDSESVSTGVVNARLGNIIKAQNDLLETMNNKSFSRHLRDIGSECTAFLRK